MMTRVQLVLVQLFSEILVTAMPTILSTILSSILFVTLLSILFARLPTALITTASPMRLSRSYFTTVRATFIYLVTPSMHTNLVGSLLGTPPLLTLCNER